LHIPGTVFRFIVSDEKDKQLDIQLTHLGRVFNELIEMYTFIV